ncbi:MAG: TauD/TfdA family dioxygenase [Verrucomicrobia bacterium]|nr:TauD/TfdA family dioxygenase [Verrucomicrobiota bacterium]
MRYTLKQLVLSFIVLLSTQAHAEQVGLSQEKSTKYFPEDIFHCYFEGNTKAPLVISPRLEESVDIIAWAKQNQSKIAKAIQEFGAIVFSGFNLTKDDFFTAFEAVTGLKPAGYKGDAPRKKVGENTYESTAVAKGHAIPLHQEVSIGSRDDMPQYISFFCVIPPKEGTGQTQVGNAAKISEEIARLMPDLWKEMTEKTLTYTARYLPEKSLRAKWIQRVNPSHATIKTLFGTEDRKEVEARCQNEGLTYAWDGDWLVVSRKGVPATITVNGKALFCNQIHLERLNPKLCGGWLPYICAKAFVYPSKRVLQFDVQFDDGTPISVKDASTLLTILEKHQEGRNWKKGDLMVLDNATTLHAKTVHSGERKIQVAMAGSVKSRVLLD